MFKLLFILFSLLPLAFMVWALVDVLKSRFPEENTKLLWVIVIILLPFIGSLLYYFIGRKDKIGSY
ncbi:PLDc N-terminal domain-containing protein [Echinicola salinicaeni]|uniref:PLDc N-terminal domain-containing protein n=1 Tax=Echinicola salinicaeni TaxID=2762757 RepID=UPI0016486F32|nr:PLD nuclease N-terminal domain-containing protein [Echinicola salinicaeni]